MMTSQFYELRIYQVERGRMGDMIARRRGALQKLFQRHGIDPLGDWYTTSGPNSPLFVYLMRWPDWNTRQEAWAGFYGDPEWAAARESSNAGSELVERYELNFLKEICPWMEAPGIAQRTIEMHIPKIDIGCSAQAHTLVRDGLVQQLAADRGQLLGAFEYLTGDNLPRAALFLSWHEGASDEPGRHYLEQRPLNRSDRYRLHPIFL